MVFGLNLAVLIPWTVVAPLEWTRTLRNSTDIFDRYVESYGSCSNENALPFVIVVLLLNVGILLLANWWAYQSRNIETEYQDSRYIGISMASVLQAWCMGVPILIVVWDNPSAKFFVEAGIVFVTALGVLLLIFTPKVLAIRWDRMQRAQEKKRSAYNKFQARSQSSRRDFDDEDSEGTEEKAASNGAAAGVSDEDLAGESQHKNSMSTAEATNSSEFTKPPPQDAADAAGVVAATGVPAAAEDATATSNGSGSPIRRASLRKSISARLLQSGAIKSDEISKRIGGIKILRNPMVSLFLGS